MSRNDDHLIAATEWQITEAMIRMGGSFVRQLGALYRAGDPQNRAKIRATWPDYWDTYGRLARASLARVQERDQ